MNKLITTLLLSLLGLSQQALANRPAAEDSSTTENATTDTAAETSTQQSPQDAPSSVDIMMHQEQTGDVVTLPPKEMQAGETLQIKLLDFPRRGMSMDKVRNEYGQPNSVSDAVGKPPITSWTYSDRIVYFEYSTVLHVVAR